MGLIELRDYLRGKGEVSATDIARHFGVEQSAVQQLAGEWLKRGKLSESGGGGSCSKGGGCSGCCSTPVGPFYRWLG
ncbi:FeoC-like transcriptional regulator [Chitinilyticum aquatile]|uniref:FeoC-like transcriptional regulator n=1 Tax=Chitinilyticum aquatile TaxID=362520 RepID=UPI00041781B8|nr:FeoC-like transcriptional regulator [Chitinilyticum aquatile]